MSTEALVLGVVGVLLTGALGLMAWTFKDVLDGIRTRLTSMEQRIVHLERIAPQMDANRADIERLWDQVGRDSNTGMRFHVHRTANFCDQHEKQITEIEHRLRERQNRR